MEGGADYRKRVHVSYAEAFKEELLHFHECIHADREPLTHANEGKTTSRFCKKWWLPHLRKAWEARRRDEDRTLY